MNALQLRMARAALGLTVRGAAEVAGVSHDTIVRLEKDEVLKPSTVAAVRTALEAAGIEFEGDGDNPTVRFRYASAIEEAALRNALVLFPGSSEWRPTERPDLRAADITAIDGDGRKMFIEVKGAHANRDRAVEQLRSLRSSYPDARLILLLVGGSPPLWDARGDVEIFQVPFMSDWSGLREMLHQDRQFRKGENVRLRDGTSLWGERKDLRGKVGRVHQLVDDGTSMNRMTVVYPNRALIEGAACGLFEPVPASET